MGDAHIYIGLLVGSRAVDSMGMRAHLWPHLSIGRAGTRRATMLRVTVFDGSDGQRPQH